MTGISAAPALSLTDTDAVPRRTTPPRSVSTMVRTALLRGPSPIPGAEAFAPLSRSRTERGPLAV
jgi:hypothetical protein